MANKRKLKPQQQRTKPKPLLERRTGGSSKARPEPPPKKKQKTKQQQQQQQQQQAQHEKPTIPFEPEDRILLVGEGDLSFAASIVAHHGCVNVTATVLERDHAELVAKYPTVDENIAVFMGTALTKEKNNDGLRGDKEEASIAKDGDQAQGDDCSDQEEDDDDDEDEGEDGPEDGPEQEEDDEESYSADEDEDDADAPRRKPPLPKNNNLLYHIDATKLTPALLRAPHFQHILFNFPHVGGKSTDTNRQVRHNQSLLVAFFERATPALAPGGSLVVTLFEGEPYTLWNVRDLARHAGLAVERSFRFQAAAYPGYRHARTCGVVRSKRGDVVGGGGWRGEDRPARSYVFRRKGEVQAAEKKKKRKKGDDSSDDDDDN
ncbi:25S rRNA (uracil(2634)-N(3))-methyltransferase [Purpureocillium takamizusanense]|uniref:25S rRNA (Uracil(2634)-N(3))-methyltransferase n=1 Tax=Purpureocillium takamizusanense TaxID=2060973 RepID=A0A9Q8QKP8_9HYPO|nr:25S rRNA (uracil(2634)-N(3))-methyltransferase [Purpureocillium takamizusanense]UNI21375.1 25S rRNA (uracil(2634)-N(3))-methyltransferase [Purpureocillium takamizusanense]